jgi:precorrin-8X/cobalt-precorrin-8 methylmutase
MPEFDAYLMVDWSASSRPVTGKDSVWYSLVVRSGDRLSLAAHENPSTRHRAMAEIRDILRGLARQEKMVLAGFDFPYGYPAGFADALGVTDTPAWLGIWREFAVRIVDREDNGNNRFEVGANLIAVSRVWVTHSGDARSPANPTQCLAQRTARDTWRRNVLRT